MPSHARSDAARDLEPTRAGRGGRPSRPVVVVWLGWLWVMAGTNMAAPLYAGYASRFGFSSLVLTLVFATYAVFLVPSSLLFGRLSDRVGRRPVILAGLASACVGLLLFAVATATWWLFAARAFQGLAVGLISGAATAALVELDAAGPERRPAVLSGLAQAGGSATGPLVAGALAQWAPAPERLTFVVGLVLTAVAAWFTLSVPEAGDVAREPWRIQRPRVPDEVRADFARVGLTAATVWGAVAMYLSVVPKYIGSLLRTDDLALIAALSAVALVASCGAQLASQRWATTPARTQVTGLGLLAVGLVALVVAAPTHSALVLLVGAVVTGAGHGVGFVSAQAELNAMVPAARRGEVTAAFICCIYLMVGSAVVTTGLLALTVSFTSAVAAVASVLAVTAVATGGWQVVAARDQ